MAEHALRWNCLSQFPEWLGVVRYTRWAKAAPHLRGGGLNVPSYMRLPKAACTPLKLLTLALVSDTILTNETRWAASHSNTHRVSVIEEPSALGWILPFWLPSPAEKAGEVMYWISISWCARRFGILRSSFRVTNVNCCSSCCPNPWHSLSICVLKQNCSTNLAHWIDDREQGGARSPPVRSLHPTHIFSLSNYEGGGSVA